MEDMKTDRFAIHVQVWNGSEMTLTMMSRCIVSCSLTHILFPFPPLSGF
jgi:hypothetical protein